MMMMTITMNCITIKEHWEFSRRSNEWVEDLINC